MLISCIASKLGVPPEHALPRLATYSLMKLGIRRHGVLKPASFLIDMTLGILQLHRSSDSI